MLKNFASLCVLWAAMAGGWVLGSAAAQAAGAPVIEAFTLSKAIIEKVEPVTLTWKVRDAATVELYDGYHNQVFSNFGLEASVHVWTDRTAGYTLIVHGLNGETVTRQLTITFLGLNIKSFDASATTLASPTDVKLAWEVTGATRVEVLDGNGAALFQAVVGLGVMVVTPDRSTTYTLKATGPQGELLTRQLTITMASAAPQIAFFQASTQVTPRGQPVRLWWKADHAVRVELYDSYNRATYTYAPNASVDVFPGSDASYRITAIGANGQAVVQEIAVTVMQPEPMIDFFYSSGGYVLVGQSATLQWKTRDATRVVIIDQQSGTQYDNQPGSGSLVVSPSQSTSYLLQAFADGGRQVQAQTQVQVTQLPPAQPAPQPYPLPSTYPGGGTIPVPYPFPYPYSPAPYYGGGYLGGMSDGVYQPLPYPTGLNGSVYYPGSYGWPGGGYGRPGGWNGGGGGRPGGWNGGGGGRPGGWNGGGGRPGGWNGGGGRPR